MKINLSIVLFPVALFAGQVIAGVDGIYEITSKTPIGTMESILTINADGSGSVKSTMGKSEFSDAYIDGNNFEFDMTVNSPIGEMQMSFEGSVDGDSVSGNISNPMGGSEFSGFRK